MLKDNRPGNRNNQLILFTSEEHFRFNHVGLSSSDLSITWDRADPAGHPEEQVEHVEHVITASSSWHNHHGKH